MNFSRNGGIQSLSTSFKSSQSYENYEPQYLGAGTKFEPKKFTSFNSANFIENSWNSDFKMFPTVTSLKSIPQTAVENNNRLQTFKNILMIAAAHKWTQKDIQSKWNQVSEMFKSGFQGSKQGIQSYLGLEQTVRKSKKSKSQQYKRLGAGLAKEVHPFHQAPKLQKHHSLNYDQLIHRKLLKSTVKAKSVEGRCRHPQQEVSGSLSKEEGLLNLCKDIEFILGQGEKRLSI